MSPTSPPPAPSSLSRAAGGGDGLLHVFVPHATAGLALMELGAGSDADLLAALAETTARGRPVAACARVPWTRADARAARVPVPPFLVIPVLAGRMALGTWQSMALIDLNVDNPDRQVRMSYLG